MKMGQVAAALRNFVQYLVGSFFLLMIVSCGGGGGSPGVTGITGGSSTAGSSTSTSSAKMTVVLTDTSGATSNSVTGSNSLIVKATVTDSSGAPAKNVVVTFSLGSDLATLSPSSGTALTDENGIAQVSVKSSGKGSGASEVTAKATVSGTTEVTEKAAFSIGAAPTATPTAINFINAVPSDSSIVIKGSGGNGRTEVALINFRVVDSSNSGVPNATVVFSTQTTSPVTLTATSGTTDASGNVTVAVNSGTQPTTVRIVATVQGTAISALSDTVTVTTGQPVQTAFSLSAEKWYVEGLNIDNVTNKVTALLADSFGGAVADGTQVVFTTNGGAIVGTGGAMCLTVNGGCSVTWRSQNPRPTGGVVTVTATATNASGNLSASRSFYMSGSFATVTVVSPTSAQTTPGGPIYHNFGTSCDPQTFSLKVSDDQNNPMPEQTTISAINTSNGTVTISPSTVQFDGSSITSGAGGSSHTLTVTPSSCSSTGTVTKRGTFDLTVKSPLGSPIPVSVSFDYRASS